MRTTINLHDDVLYAAKERAHVSNLTLGEWISMRLRESLVQEKKLADEYSEVPDDGLGIPVIKAGTRIVSNHMINELRNELGI